LNYPRIPTKQKKTAVHFPYKKGRKMTKEEYLNGLCPTPEEDNKQKEWNEYYQSEDFFEELEVLIELDCIDFISDA
jgi:hypothetical protein